MAALNAAGRPAVLDVIGRFGWGDETEKLKAAPHVTLHGYLEPDAARALIGAAHILISTSKDEGLGLTLLEAQHAGLEVVATDMPVFREVLGDSGLLVDPARPEAAAASVLALLAGSDPGERATRALDNVARWNTAAERDRADVIARLAAKLAGGR